MNKLYQNVAVAAACGMLMLGNGSTAQAQKLDNSFKSPRKALVQKQRNTRANIQRAMPQKIENYTTEDGENWSLMSVTELQYDAKYNVVQQVDVAKDAFGAVSFATKDSYTYNQDGNLVENITQVSSDAVNWENDNRLVKAYDTVSPNEPVLFENYLWLDNNWTLNEEFEDGYFMEVERDDKNRVTKSTRWLNSTKSFTLYTNEYFYNGDGPATGMRWNLLDENFELVPAYIFDDMVWKKSNQQYINVSPNLYYAFDLDENNNLTSYSLYFSDVFGHKSDPMAKYKTTYDEQDRITSVVLNFPDGHSYYKCEYKYDTDANGSFEMYEYTMLDEDYDGTVSEEEKVVMHSVTTMNDHGEITKEEVFTVNPADQSETIIEGYGYEMTYDESDLLKELLLSYYSEYVGTNGGYTYFAKMVYSDYYNGEVSGVESVNSGRVSVAHQGNSLVFDNAQGAHYKVCDMQGKTYLRGVVNSQEVSLGNLPKGMYVVKVSGKCANNAVKFIQK